MTVSTLDQISAYPAQFTSSSVNRLIPENETPKPTQERSDNLNKELLNAIAKAETERSQPSINPTTLDDATRQLVVGITAYNSKIQQLEIYINGMNEDNNYEGNQIDTLEVLKRREENTAQQYTHSLYA